MRQGRVRQHAGRPRRRRGGRSIEDLARHHRPLRHDRLTNEITVPADQDPQAVSAFIDGRRRAPPPPGLGRLPLRWQIATARTLSGLPYAHLVRL
ncbi:hypothetical protein ACFYXM_21985 [Streptomyces sp. NPDC002476]|uniref:hypothetical protein n=1 Tax=Streptomyces sp. NPDC002476 TaxID=3364648 RepID=UPI0036C26A18